MHRPLAFLIRDVITETSYATAFIMQFAGVLVSATMFYFIAQSLGGGAAEYLKPYGGDFFTFVVIGLAFGSYFGTGLQAFARALREAQTTGTLEAMLMTPSRVSTIILSSALWSYLFTTLRVVLYFVIGSTLFGMRLPLANYGTALLALGLALISFSSVGILAASFVMLFKRGDPITSVLTSSINLLGGVYFPVEVILERVPWLAPLIQVIPLTYALRAMRLALVQGAGLSELAGDLLALAVFAALLLPLSLLVFRWTVDRARMDGSLAQF